MDASNNNALLALNRAQQKAHQDLRQAHANVTQELERLKERASRLSSSEDHLKMRVKNLEHQKDQAVAKLEHTQAAHKVWRAHTHTVYLAVVARHTCVSFRGCL